MPEYTPAAQRVVDDLLARIGEAAPQPRLEPTRRAVDLLGDPQRAYPIVHITGTNGKTTTSRLIESVLRAYGLRTGLLTSPHLVKLNERIMIDGEPISDDRLVEQWEDIQPYLTIVDAELEASGEAPLTFFEALTVLAFAAFADAPVDVAVIEVGMGGEWDSTNVGDGQVAVLAPIALDHTHRLGNTIEEIARTKSGIIKPLAEVVSAAQRPEALAEIVRAAELTESTLHVEGPGFALLDAAVAVGGQQIAVQGLAGRYDDLFLPLYGDHQGHNAALAIAAVESFLGRGTQPLVPEVLADGLAQATSPGRLQVIARDPLVVVDAAHNPHGAHSLVEAVPKYFDLDEIAYVTGILADKDAHGVITELASLDEVAVEQGRSTRIGAWYPTASHSERALSAEEVAELVREIADIEAEPLPLDEALRAAREWATQGLRRGVVVTGSITLIGEVIDLAEQG